MFQSTIDEKRRAQLPDSIVIRIADGEILTRSTAALFALRGLGGAGA